jgi:hypothetical protein
LLVVQLFERVDLSCSFAVRGLSLSPIFLCKDLVIKMKRQKETRYNVLKREREREKVTDFISNFDCTASSSQSADFGLLRLRIKWLLIRCTQIKANGTRKAVLMLIWPFSILILIYYSIRTELTSRRRCVCVATS